MFRSVTIRAPLTSKRICESRLRRIRKNNMQLDSSSMLDLITASVADNNESSVPTKKNEEQNVKDAIKALRANLPTGDKLLIPSYGYINSARNEDTGAWLPEDFSSKSEGHLKDIFGIKVTQGVLSVLPLIDKSFHSTTNNEALAKCGETIIHMYTRRLALEMQEAHPKEHLRFGVELATDGNLSRVLRGYLPISRSVLTDMETAYLLDSLCYYGTILGASTVASYPIENKVVKTQENSKSTKIRVYSTCLKALVGAVYLENGIDAAVDFIEKYICPKLKKILDGTIK
eukprot:TRINITY_DN21984_c0_g1_i1.p1 TRINITY_DN21984_c0_g1~~TRINITY_DN21984_c0_g1_i1.p1  ORF type:complete len:307 (+),score=48.44 TRINITY_DN21984_c0_g1_i1:60-923(+)